MRRRSVFHASSSKYCLREKGTQLFSVVRMCFLMSPSLTFFAPSIRTECTWGASRLSPVAQPMTRTTPRVQIVRRRSSTLTVLARGRRLMTRSWTRYKHVISPRRGTEECRCGSTNAPRPPQAIGAMRWPCGGATPGSSVGLSIPDRDGTCCYRATVNTTSPRSRRCSSRRSCCRRPARGGLPPSSRESRGRLDFETVASAELGQPVNVRRRGRRGRNLAPLRRLARFGEELVDPTGLVGHDHAELARGLEVLELIGGDADQRSGPAIDLLPVDVQRERSLDDVHGFRNATVNVCRWAHACGHGHLHDRRLAVRLVARQQDLVEPAEHPEGPTLTRLVNYRLSHRLLHW